MKNKKIIYSLLIVLLVVCLLLVIYIFSNSNNKFVKENNEDATNSNTENRIYFNDFEENDCKKEKNKEICEKDLGTLSISEIAHATIKVQRISSERKTENYLYINNNKAKIDNNYILNYIEPIKYNKENFEILLLFINVKNEQGLDNSMLINLQGDIEKKLTSNYNNSYYETNILNDGNLYIFYNTCENNTLQRHKLNLNYIIGDTVLYEEKVLVCN